MSYHAEIVLALESYFTTTAVVFKVSLTLHVHSAACSVENRILKISQDTLGAQCPTAVIC